MNEQLEALRELLGLRDRYGVSIVNLVGEREVTQPDDVARRFERSGDVAFVFVGPASKMVGTWEQHDNGGRTIIIRIDP
jgi:hypothetical protein